MQLDSGFDTIGVPWPAGFAESLAAFLRDPQFLRLPNSWKLLHFLNTNWKQLSAEDCLHLKPLLIDTFDKHADWMGAFVGAEILGERYPDESTLSIFVQLAKNAALLARELVPHGIEYLAKSTQNESLRQKAITALQSLQQSDSESMRGEAAISLRKLGHT